MKTQVKTGVAAIKAVYERALEEKAVDFVCLSVNYPEVLGNYYDEDFTPRLAKSGVETREILADVDENRDGDGEREGIRFMPGKPLESDLVVASDWAALISYEVTEPLVVMVEAMPMVASLKRYFEQLWSNL